MRRGRRFLMEQQGMTLLEVLVTLGILSMVFIGTLRLYSTTYKNLRTRHLLVETIHDANLVMAYIGDDIRQADQVLSNYTDTELDTVVAAMKMIPAYADERVVIYSLDAKRPTSLIRSVKTGTDRVSIQLSTLVKDLEIIPKNDKLFEVKLTLEDVTAGEVSTLQVSSAYALRK